MTILRRIATSAVAVATLGAAAYLTPIATASAGGYGGYGGYYKPSNGYYGAPYRYQRRHCSYVRVPYRWDYYGRATAWHRVRRCG